MTGTVQAEAAPIPSSSRFGSLVHPRRGTTLDESCRCYLSQIERLFLAIRYPVQVIDFEGNTVLVNEPFLGLFGIRSTKKLFSSFNAFRDMPFPKKRIRSLLKRLEQGDAVFLSHADVDFDAIGKAIGSNRHGTVPVSTNAVPICGEGGKPCYIAIMRHDFSDVFLSRYKLNRSETLYRNIISQSNDGFLMCDESGRIVEYNPAMERITGYRRRESSGKYVWDMQLLFAPKGKVSREQEKRYVRSLKDIFTTHTSPLFNTVVDAEIQTRKGNVLPVQSSAFSVHCNDGTFCGMGIFIRDMTRAAVLHPRRNNRSSESHSNLRIFRDNDMCIKLFF